MLSRLWKIPYFNMFRICSPMRRSISACCGPGRLTQYFTHIERMGYRKAALVSTLTEAMREKIINKGFAPEKVVLFSDWARPELFDVPADGWWRTIQAVASDSASEFLVVHAGNMGVKQGLEVILGAAERSREDRGIKYLLVGDGSVREQLEQRAEVPAAR